MTTLTDRVRELQQLGFDRTTRSGKHLYPRCSQCEVLVINGVPTHELGCPNILHDARPGHEEDY